jgi:hypothetical protein
MHSCTTLTALRVGRRTRSFVFDGDDAMPGFTVSDGSALGSIDLHGRDRNAAIAAMGQRLAAAGLRMRRRNIVRDHVEQAAARDLPSATPANDEDRTPFPPHIWVDRDLAEWAARVPPERDMEQVAPHWRDYLGTARQVATLGATGACGFALVIFALHVGAMPRGAVPVAHVVPTAQARTVETGSALAPVATASVALAPAVVPRQVARVASAPLRLPAFVPAVATEAAPATPDTPHIVTLHAQTLQRAVVAARRTDAVAARARTRRIAPAAIARAVARPHGAASRVAAGHEHWPRWLTDDQASRPRIIMSEPPHDLTQPPDKGGPAALAASAPSSVNRAPVVVASSGEGAAGSDRGPVYRPYYGGSGYYPYQYPFNGYYGGGYRAGTP